MKTEDWTKDINGMTSTCVVQVDTEEVVKIDEVYLEEFGFNKEYGHPGVDPFREHFVWTFPVAYVRRVMEKAGWTRATAPPAQV